MGVDDLTVDDRQLTSDSDKARALAYTFFLRLPSDLDASPPENLDVGEDAPSPISTHFVPVTQREIF